ncbi:hypothetical protein PO909_001389 [Leuciscus waleckii]
MYPVSQSWAMCGNDGTVLCRAKHMRTKCWWKEYGPDQSIDYLAQIRLVTRPFKCTFPHFILPSSVPQNPFSLGPHTVKNDCPVVFYLFCSP